MADSPFAFENLLYKNIKTLDYASAITPKIKATLFDKLAAYLQEALNIEQITWTVSAIQREDPTALLCLMHTLAEKWGRHLDLPAYLNIVVVRTEKVGSAVRNKVVLVKVWDGWADSNDVQRINDEGLTIILT